MDKPNRANPATRGRGQTSVLILIALIAALATQPALAFSFQPTAQEWAIWPEYCKARYASMPIGERNPLSANYPKPRIEQWRQTLGQETFVHIQHFCASKSWEARAATAESTQARIAALQASVNNAQYAAERIPRSSPLYAEVQAQYVMVSERLAWIRTTK